MEEAKCHINVIELRAAALVLKALLQSQEPQHSGGIYQQERGTRSPPLTAQALELWAVALTAGVSLTAQHIPGIQNVIADTASRQREARTQWTWTGRSSNPFARDSTHQKWTSLHPV